MSRNSCSDAEEPPRFPTLGGRIKDWIKVWTRQQIENRDDLVSPFENAPLSTFQTRLNTIAAQLPGVTTQQLERAAEVGREARHYYHVSRQTKDDDEPQTPFGFTKKERRSLVDEREKLFSQKGMLVIIITVSLAAFLQGHVQASLNGGTLFVPGIGLDIAEDVWKLGAMNASPYFFSAVLGAPMSLPINYCFGRRGALIISALLIIASSLGSAWCRTWVQLFGVRIVAGVGMGIKAVSAPILASETAVGFWRGSTILAWQLWVACGIMVGNVINLVIAAITGAITQQNNGSDGQGYLTLQLILGAPVIPGVFLLIAVCFCYESPRFYMRLGTPNYSLSHAFQVLSRVRQSELQALRDLLLIWWSNTDGGQREHEDTIGLTYAGRISSAMKLSRRQYRTLFKTPRLRNATWSTCTVNLAQQLCGINVFAFYSNIIFVSQSSEVKSSMVYSFGFGAINFFFGLFAMRSIDLIGRRRLLLWTLPLMSLSLAASAIAFAKTSSYNSDSNFKASQNYTSGIVAIVFIYVFAAIYSPSLGPIPFTLASESFPLSHREAGASVAISFNLFFAGLLTILLPTIQQKFGTSGTLGFFAGLNIVAFIMVFFLVAETRRLTLEELDRVFELPMRDFVRYQLKENFPYIFNRWFRRQKNLRVPRQPYEARRRPSSAQEQNIPNGHVRETTEIEMRSTSRTR